MNPNINFNVDQVQAILRDRYNIATEIFHEAVPNDLHWLGTYPKWRDHTGVDRWTVIAGPFGLDDIHEHAHIANIGVFKYKHDSDSGDLLGDRSFSRTVREDQVADALAEYAKSVWRYPDAEDLEDPRRTFFSGEWLVTNLDDSNRPGFNPRWEYCVEGTQTGRWSGGCEFLVDQVGLEHILQQQEMVSNNEWWFQWDGDDLLYVPASDNDLDELQRISPTEGGEYEMGFGWTWYDVDPLQCDLVIPASVNPQNIIRIVMNHGDAYDFLADPPGWLERHGVNTAPTWAVEEAADMLRPSAPRVTRTQAPPQLAQARVATLPAQSYDSLNPNVNCLEGRRCPSCGQVAEIDVKAVVWVSMADDGITNEGDHDFDDTSPARCSECNFVGTWGDFRQKVTMTAGQLIQQLQKLPAETPLLGYLGAGIENYVNVDGVHFDPTNPDIAATIELRDDYDTRQW